jgi:hypothetical protein
MMKRESSAKKKKKRYSLPSSTALEERRPAIELEKACNESYIQTLSAIPHHRSAENLT